MKIPCRGLENFKEISLQIESEAEPFPQAAVGHPDRSCQDRQSFAADRPFEVGRFRMQQLPWR